MGWVRRAYSSMAPAQHRVVQQAEKLAMKALVAVEHAARVAVGDRRIVFALHGHQRRQPPAARADLAGGMHLQHLSQRVQLHDLAREKAHHRADIALFLHRAQRFQLGQDLAAPRGA